MKPSFESSVKLLGISLFLLVANCACNPVISKKVVGESPAKLIAAEWEGNWLTPDGPVTLKVDDEANGILSASWSQDEHGRKTMKTARLEIREYDKWLFASVKDDDKGQSRGYFWGRVRKDSRQIVVWEPDQERFAQLVKEGSLPGKLDGKDVILNGLTSIELKALTSGKLGVPFNGTIR